MSDLDTIFNQLFAEVKHIHDVQHQLVSANNKLYAKFKTLRADVNVLMKPKPIIKQPVTKPSEQVVSE